MDFYKRLYFFGSPKPMGRLIWKKTKMSERSWSCKKFNIIIKTRIEIRITIIFIETNNNVFE